jgi:uncharacterized protein
MLYKLDGDGLVTNEAHPNKIQGDIRVLTEELLQELRRVLEANLLSFIVRGSVSVGKAIANLSDLDLVAVLPTEPSNTTQQHFAHLCERYESCTKLVTGIDLILLSERKLLKSPQYTQLRTNISVRACTIYGEDLLPKLPKVKPGRDLASTLYGNIETEFSWLSRVFKGEIKNPSYNYRIRPTQFWCVWTTRTILRFGMGIVMMTKPIFTTDLETCYEEFVTMYPKHKDGMALMLRWSREPVSDCDLLNQHLARFGKELVVLWKKSQRR